MLGELANACKAEPTRAKWVLVPAHALGHTLGERLAREVGGWANVRFTTPRDLAMEAAAPHLVEAGIDPIAEDLGGPLAMRLLRDLPAGVPTYFRGLADHHSMGDALWSTIAELRLAGIGSRDLAAIAFKHPAKHAELQAFLAAYESWLATTRCADVATIFRTALDHVADCAVRSDDLVFELPHSIWPPLVRQFIRALPGEHRPARVPALPGVPLPRRLAADAPVEYREASPLARLFEPLEGIAPPDRSTRPDSGTRPDGDTSPTGGRPPEGGTPPEVSAPPPKSGAPPGRSAVPERGTRHDSVAQPDGSTRTPVAGLAFFRAGGPEAEIEEVFRRILALNRGRGRLDEVEIACASHDYPLLVCQKAARYGWPVTIEPGLPGAATRPVRALLSWCDWIESGLAASRLRRMLASGDLRVDIEGGPGAGGAARLLLRASPTWGRDTYARALGALVVAERDRADDLERDEDDRARHAKRAADADRLREWIGRLLAPIPPTEGDSVPLGALVSAALDFVERAAATRSELDASARTAIEGPLRALHLLGDASCGLVTALNMIRAALDGIRIAADRPRPGHLHVSTLSRAGFAHRPFTFVVGLQEGQVFPSFFEDPVLLDSEREQLHDSLARSTDRTAELVHAVASRLADLPCVNAGAIAGANPGAGADGPAGTGAPADTRAHAPAICLSYSCRDVRDARQTFPSSIVLQAFRLTRPHEHVTFGHLDTALDEPVSQVPPAPDRALSDAGWWLANLKKAPTTCLTRVREAFPDLASGMAAEAARASAAFTAFDGLAPSAADALDPRRSGCPVSPTGLERLATCPFAYFLEVGLGLEPIDEAERDADAWLDALTRGSLLHDLFAEVMRHLRATNARASRALHLLWLLGRADARLSALADEMPPPSDEVFARERDDIRRDLNLFLDAEEKAAARGTTPIGFEVGFGRRDRGDEEPLGQADPVAVRLPGPRFLLSGRIDRIDRLPGGAYQVVDYKTGSLYWPNYRKVFRHGRLLQHALYAVAAESLLRGTADPTARVRSGRYAFVTAKGAGRSRVIERPPDRDLGRVLTALLDIAGAGAFMARADARDRKTCEFCAYSGLCGGLPVVKRAEAKLDNAANTALDPYRRLLEEENA